MHERRVKKNYDHVDEMLWNVRKRLLLNKVTAISNTSFVQNSNLVWFTVGC